MCAQSPRGDSGRSCGRGTGSYSSDARTTVLVAESIETFDKREWEVLFEGQLESWHYVRAIERARLARCEMLYFAVLRDGECVAAVPAFIGPRALVRARPSAEPEQDSRADSDRVLVFGLPLGGACRIGFAPHTTAGQQHELLALLLRAAGEAVAIRRLGGIVVGATEERQSELWRPALATLPLVRLESAPLARLSLPAWSFDDYLSGLNVTLRSSLWSACEQAGHYELRWRVDLAGDLGEMLELCAEAGLKHINAACFENLLGPSVVCANCLIVRAAGALVAFNLVLHDARLLREEITVVSREAQDTVVGALIFLETVRFCLECGIAVYESASATSLAASQPGEIVERAGWLAMASARSGGCHSWT